MQFVPVGGEDSEWRVVGQRRATRPQLIILTFLKVVKYCCTPSFRSSFVYFSTFCRTCLDFDRENGPDVPSLVNVRRIVVYIYMLGT